MASWTDIIPKFNPYVEQLPVDAMVKVGMQKQAQYDQGIQKIQSEIDNIAGLDISRDVEKNYLQTKLNELGDKLTFYAAGDFSNFQLQNSVSGMTKQLVKDPVIQNAVSSTAWYKKQLAEMQKAKSEGKSSIQNQWDFTQKASKWLNSTDLNESFKETYTPYIDVKKKAVEAIKQLHPNLTQYDIPFEMKDGKINTGKIADAMKRYKIEGIDESQIQQAIYASLTPDDINQLSIDARFQFRDVTPEQLADRAKLNYEFRKKDAINSLELLNKQKVITTNPEKLIKIDESIKYYEKLIGKDGSSGILDEELSENLNNAKNNPDGVKLSIYKDGFVKEFANAFSWKNQTEEFVTNPLKQQQNWVAEMNFKQQVENRHRYEFSEQMKREDMKIQLSAEANALKRAELYGVDSPWTTIGNPTDTELNSVKLYTEHANSVNSSINGEKNKLLNAGYSENEINAMINSYEKNPSGASIPAKAVGAIQSILRNKNYLTSLQEKEKNLRAEADKEAGILEIKQRAIQNKPGLDVTINGTRHKLSPEEILQIKLATSEKIIGRNRQGQAKEVNVDMTGMNANQIAFVNSLRGVKYGTIVTGPQSSSTLNVLSNINNVFSRYEESAKNVKSAFAESSRLLAKKLAPLAQEFVPQIKALGSSKDGSPTPITIEQLSGLITARNLQGVAADENWDFNTASDFLSEKKAKDTRVFIMQNGGNYEVWIKNEQDPSNIQKISVTQEEVSSRFGNKYVNPRTQESYRLKVGRGNTNVTKDATRSLMQKQFGDFPGIRKFNITADLEEDLNRPGEFIPMINIMKKDGRYQNFEIAGEDKLKRLGFDQGKNQLNSLTDDQLIKLLKQHYPNFDYSILQTY
jgi:hypothetical protein